MARPLKDGADYFPKDTDFYTKNDKVKLLRAEFGAKGMYMLDYLLCEIYDNGYYIKWDADKCALVSDGAGCGCSPDFVSEFVHGCLRRSMFNKGVFEKFGVLTSAGIQRRFIRMLNQRKKYTFISEYFLLDIDDSDDVPEGILNKITFKKIISTENEINNNENPIKNIDNSQTKQNNSKQNESKQNNSNNTDAAAVVSAYENNIGPISPGVREKLLSWLEDVDVSLILYAINQAVENDVKKPVYIYSILNNQCASGITSAQQIKKEGRQKPKPPKPNKFNGYSNDYGSTDLEKEIMNRRLKENKDNE